jgi:hypothetical protein
MWGMNVGCLIDVEQYAFSYVKKFKFLPTLAAGAVLYGTPVIFPMKTDGKGRWIRSIV